MPAWIYKKCIQMKIFFKVLTKIAVLMTILLSMAFPVFAEKPIQDDAKRAYDLSVVAANNNNLILARRYIEDAIKHNYSNLDYLAFATDIAFIAKDYDKAEEYQVMMLLVAQSTLGLDDLQIAEILDQLAAINAAQKRNEQAKFRLLESLALREKVLGQNHLLVISSLNKLALLAARQNAPDIAEPLLKRSLDIARKVSGPKHGNSAVLLASLGDFYQKEGRLKEAESHYKEAISIWENKPDYSPDRMLTQNSLGQLLLRQQRFDDAYKQFEQVLLLLKRHYEPDHPYVQQAVKNIKTLEAEHKRITEQELIYDELVKQLTLHLSQG